MRVSNPSYVRKHGDEGRFHILDSIATGGTRYMKCSKVIDASRAIEVRFDLEPEAIREQVCGVCVAAQGRMSPDKGRTIATDSGVIIAQQRHIDAKDNR